MSAPRRSTAARAAARVGYRGLLGVTALSDFLPARLRFGHWQKVLSLLAVRSQLPVVPREAWAARAQVQGETPPERGTTLRCVLLAGELDSGGVEAVVSALARGLPAHGFHVDVVVTREGRVSGELREAGVAVTPCSPDGLADLVAGLSPDVVELHRPDLGHVAAMSSPRAPVVPVFHAVESYLSAEAWARLRQLVRRAPVCVAVSDGVREFFVEQTGALEVSVVVNGVAPVGPGGDGARDAARSEVSRAIGRQLGADDIVVVGLQRYSDQKNAAGLVDAFLHAAEAHERLHLVLAGSPDNWLEFRRADVLRRASAHGDRVHLLGDSDAQTILRAGDVYALDSFAEGGPLTAVEAVIQGLPVVLSDVGFARELVAQPGVDGEVVDRANRGFEEADLAAQRRRRRQSNRDAFAAALLRAASKRRGVAGVVPPAFTERAMVAGHAAALRRAAVSES